MPAPVITRFAPSPTGFLHIGSARTALFNWLYAKARGGQMRLRIEDTDKERSTPEAVSAILEGLEWLGIGWEGEPVYQHKRADAHRDIAMQLLASNKAYRCYCTPGELADMRERARDQGRRAVYDRTWRERDPAQAPEGVSPAIRFKAPMTGETVIDDHVQGRVVVQNENLDDLVLLRSDGTPTYMLSVVVDDHDMAITHIIRGDDHLTNAARQAQIYHALSWDVPVFAHIPLIHGPDGAKLSKRHGALGLEAYRDMGYLPDALRNYLVRLGWSHGDDEIMSGEQMVEWFDIDGINKAAARFDFAKLDSVNGHYIRHRADDILAAELIAFITRHAREDLAGIDDMTAFGAQLVAAMPGLKERSKTLAELALRARFIFAARPLVLDDKARKLLDAHGLALLAETMAILRTIDDWRAETLEKAIKDFVNDKGLKLGEVAQPLRAALTGTTVSPGIFDVISVLGKEETLSRIGDLVTND